jgi:hypothetical protein
MVVVLLLTVGLPVLVLGLRLLFHVADPKSYGPAGTPGVFQVLCQPMPTWAMISVIVGWSVIGAWRMMTRDA